MGDPSLDFTSPLFDPLKALYTDGLQPPMAMKALDNIASYESLMQGKKRTAVANAKGGNVSSREGQSQSEAGSSSCSARQKSEKSGAKPAVSTNYRMRTVLDKMQEEDEGPLKVLQNCWKQHCLVKVWIRRAAGLRGILTGYILAYDKHMNLAMEDVHEEWVANPRQNYMHGVAKQLDSLDIKGDSESETVESSKGHQGGDGQQMESLGDDTNKVKSLHGLCSSSAVAQPEPIIKHRKRRKRICKEAVEPVVSNRFVKQLFIRGDNIVMVSPYKLTRAGR